MGESRGLEILKINTALHLGQIGFDIIKKNQFNFEKCCNDVCFFVEIVDSLSKGKADGQVSETDTDTRTIRILREYADNKKYLWMVDDLGWAAHEFFHAFCYSQIGWVRNDRDMYNFFNSNDAEIYPCNFAEYIPFGGQFAVMKSRGLGKNIDTIVNMYDCPEYFENYIKIANTIK